MKDTNIEWRHYDREGETCTRCNNTGDNINKALETISKDERFKGVKISFKERKLEAEQMPESNLILINEKPVEDILEASASENYCHSCTCLAGEDTNCRTRNLNDKQYEDIPEELIINAISTVLKK